MMQKLGVGPSWTGIRGENGWWNTVDRKRFNNSLHYHQWHNGLETKPVKGLCLSMAVDKKNFAYRGLYSKNCHEEPGPFICKKTTSACNTVFRAMAMSIHSSFRTVNCYFQ